MGGIFNNPAVDLCVFSVTGVLFLTRGIWEFPNPVDRRTKKPRTWVERWRLANRDTKGSLVVGTLCVFTAIASVVMLISNS